MSLPTTATIVGVPLTLGGLSVFPLLRTADATPVDLRLAGDELVVSELETPTVPTLQVHNPTAMPLLIPAGRILAGGRQTRTVNVSIIVGAGQTLPIPVSCVEAGRWNGGRRFTDSRRVASRRVRAAKQRSVAQNLRNFGHKRSDQSIVWGNIDAELDSRGLDHESRLYLAAESALDDRGDRMEQVHRLRAEFPKSGQVGVAIAHGPAVSGFEVFATEEAFAEAWESIARAAVLDADLVEESAGVVDVAAIEDFLRSVAAADAVTSAGVGLGVEHHVDAERFVAHALVLDDTVVYANAFASVE